ncbi:phosphocholine cytidylyltransferase family protein [Aneurinibacillus migulanus]|uniref:Choline kinase n=1 Tax=Aneurinibacillus migulanus TaxID=47500 RepID=A0A0D1XJK2_ANEMI|nr:phosphocholine cytidylyltransferase family protein [Aneurinibacillus migulanus]KIV52438.1 hypothetical protein TS65_23830 [Aneurinibacillus migulanus]KON94614.1 hypothetical protein AF333_03010 [Aneurinibacillus migulanus]MED0892662.1 phosphocholine cytidylyltransferase family protein [Aneurinibacillus migulanus]MED1614303.1 phosphocholine cytidylyltransferase family protein [Aneurinibacillus migulanus]SDI48018.1 Choline kinase [Aneurinibacillus migulanus]
MLKKAVIVAAGLSSRLYPLTLEEPKCLLEVNRQPILKRTISILKKNNINEIFVVIGYQKDRIIDSIGPDIQYIVNPFYQHCNNMGSLWFGKNFVGREPFIYLHGDVLFHPEIISQAIKHFSTSENDMELMTDFGETDEEAMKVRVTEDKFLLESNKEISSFQSAGEWTGIACIRSSRTLFEYIEKVMFNDGLNFYDTYAFTNMVKDGYKIQCISTLDYPWIEVDFLSDYEKAKEMFESE